MKTIMILGAGVYQLPAIIRAREMGLCVVACDINPDAVGFREEGVIRRVVSVLDSDGVLGIARECEVDGVLTICSEYGVRSAARVASELGLPGITERAAFMGTDKAAMRRRLAERGVPIPKFESATTMEGCIEAVRAFEGKCVVKAVDSAGSSGIKLLDANADTATVEEAYRYCKAASRSGELVVEEYMDGPEVCVETLNFDGICHPVQITDQLRKSPPYFTDAGYNQPSFLSEEEKARVAEVAVEANMALENYCGSSCSELIVTEEGPKVVEVGLRLAGDFMTTRMVPLSTGVDMVEAVIRIALGERVAIEPTIDKGTCIRFFMKERVGTICAVTGVDEAKAVPGVIEVGMLKGVGEVAVPLRKGTDRLGYVITQMDTAEAAVECAERALSMIDFVVDGGGSMRPIGSEAALR